MSSIQHTWINFLTWTEESLGAQRSQTAFPKVPAGEGLRGMEGYLGMVCLQALLRIFILSVPSLKPVSCLRKCSPNNHTRASAASLPSLGSEDWAKLWEQLSLCLQWRLFTGAGVGRRVGKPHKLVLEKI